MQEKMRMQQQKNTIIERKQSDIKTKEKRGGAHDQCVYETTKTTIFAFDAFRLVSLFTRICKKANHKL